MTKLKHDSLRRRVLERDRRHNTERQMQVTERPVETKQICWSCRRTPDVLALLLAWTRANPSPWAGSRRRWPGLEGRETGQCAECGAAWVRVTEQVDSGRTQKMADGWDTGSGGHGTVHRAGREPGAPGVPVLMPQTVGWRPSCAHAGAPVRQTILDPFAGAGTVGLVADRLGRNAVLCELSESYSDMGAERLVGDAPLFTEVVA